MRKRRVVILGASGSIGQSALRVARDIPDRMEIVGLSAHGNAAALEAAAREFPRAHCVRTDGPDGAEKLLELATLTEADLVLVAIVGTAGLRPALAALEAGKDLAVASKEILVMAGEAVTSAAARTGATILPVDSEHNAIFQCLEGRDTASVRRLILTCSGGPLLRVPRAEFEDVTPARALKHPTWSMGRKITIDSATLFNKALEMIEARWLFGIPMRQVEVVIHPQSVIHSMVEFVDGSTLAQLSRPDMCFPIHYAVTWPDRVPSSLAPLDFAALARLDFEAPRRDDFPALDLAVEAGSRGGTLPAALNAANEVAVDAFLREKITFPRIWGIVRETMERSPFVEHPSLGEILSTDRAAREIAAGLL